MLANLNVYALPGNGNLLSGLLGKSGMAAPLFLLQLYAKV
jgi:hypothetical protein